MLLEPHTDQAKEELPGLPLTFYPDDAEDPLWTQVRPEGEIGSSPGELGNCLVESCPAPRSACCGRIPADPVADPSATVRALGWDVVELGRPVSPLTPHPQGRQYSSSIGQRAYICLQSAE